MCLQVGAQCDILRATFLWISDFLVRQVGSAVNARVRSDHKENAAARGTCNDLERRPVTLGITTHRRSGSNNINVDRASQQSLNLAGAGVEGLRLQLHLASQLLLKCSVCHAYQS